MQQHDEYGGPEGKAVRWRNDSTRRVRHAREVASARITARRKRIEWSGLSFLFGFLLLLTQVTAERPWVPLIAAGIILCLPLLVELQRGDQ